MRNPLALIRRQPDAPRPTLKARAAALRATAAKVLRRPTAAAEAQPDPILATIEESRRLFEAWSAALELPPIPGRADREEVDQAREAFYRHRDTVLLLTVPSTGQGCATLAGYVRSHYAADRFVIEENEHGDANFRVLDLIARSPACAAPGDAEAIRAATRAVAKREEITRRAPAEDWNDDTLGRHCDELNRLIAATTETPATTREGFGAKARLVLSLLNASSQEPDQDERLTRSLLADLIAAEHTR